MRKIKTLQLMKVIDGLNKIGDKKVKLATKI
jgi:hypothetical protein